MSRPLRHFSSHSALATVTSRSRTVLVSTRLRASHTMIHQPFTFSPHLSSLYLPGPPPPVRPSISSIHLLCHLVYATRAPTALRLPSLVQGRKTRPSSCTVPPHDQRDEGIAGHASPSKPFQFGRVCFSSCHFPFYLAIFSLTSSVCYIDVPMFGSVFWVGVVSAMRCISSSDSSGIWNQVTLLDCHVRRSAYST